MCKQEQQSKALALMCKQEQKSEASALMCKGRKVSHRHSCASKSRKVRHQHSCASKRRKVGESTLPSSKDAACLIGLAYFQAVLSFLPHKLVTCIWAGGKHFPNRPPTTRSSPSFPTAFSTRTWKLIALMMPSSNSSLMMP